MKHYYLLFVFLCLIGKTYSQNYAIGHHSENYIDAARSNRSIQTEVYYPANVAGDDVPLANGQFPIIVYGHGFTIAWSNYDYMWQYFVAKGYICVFPRTEGGIFPAPNHLAFGLDLAFLSNLFPNVLNTTNGNLFEGHVAPETCIAGHSMGGGASFLGCENNSQVTTMVTMSAAETNPQASTAAQSVNIPTMVMVGGNDCVAPATTNAQLFYNSLPNSICKYYVNLTEGSHCAFASSGATTCYSAEGLQCPTATYIPAQTQRDRTLALWEPWLRYYLKHDCAGWTDFTNVVNTMTAANELTEQHNCTQTVPAAIISPAGATLCEGDSVTFTVTGATAYSWSNGSTNNSITVSTAGNYSVSVSNGICSTTSTANVVVNPNPATPILTQNGNAVTCTSNGMSYSWAFNGSPYPFTTQSISPESSGTIVVIVTDNNGCSANSSPFLFTYTGLENVAEIASVNIAPNPFEDYFSIQIESHYTSEVEIALSDIQGNIIFIKKENVYNYFEKKYTIKDTAQGIYFLTIKTPTGKISYKLLH